MNVVWFTVFADNGRTLFTFIARLRPASPKRVSACSVELSCTVRILLVVLRDNWLSSTTTAQKKQLLTFSVAETRCSQTLWLIHSLTVPGGLVALRDLFPVLFPSSLVTSLDHQIGASGAHVGAPKTPDSMHFSPGSFSLRLQSFSLRLAPSSSSPDVGKFACVCACVYESVRECVCVCRQLVESSLSAVQVSSPSTCAKSQQSTETKLV